jgi:hypothetical protein
MSDDRELVERLAATDATPRAGWVAELRADLDAAWETGELPVRPAAPQPSRPSRPTRWLPARTWLVPSISGAAIALLILALVFIPRDGPDVQAPSNTEPPVATPAPSVATTTPSVDTTAPASTVDTTAPASTVVTPVTPVTPVVSSGLPVDGWQQVELPNQLTDVKEIITVADQFVAVGSVGSGGDRTGIWQSSDGVNWDERLVFTRRTLDDPRIWATDVAVTGDGVTMIAERNTNDVREVVAFHSGEGATDWSEMVLHQWDQPNYRDLQGVSFVYGDAGVVFTVEGSSDMDEGLPGGGEITGTLVWVADGDGGWRYVDPADSGLAQVWVWAIAASDDGYVAVGDTREDRDGWEGCQTQALWRSPDAVTWTKVWEFDEPCRWYVISDLFEFGGEWFVARTTNPLTANPLSEPELHLWRITGDSMVDVAIEPFEATQMLFSDVTVHDGVLIAVGSGPADPWGGGEIRLWLSDDAHTWSPVDLPAEQLIGPEVAHVAANDDRIIVLGREWSPSGPKDILAWVRESAEG